MARKFVGIDVGSRAVHLVVAENGQVNSIVSEPLPEGMVVEERIISYEAMGDFLKEVRKKHRLKAKDVCLILHDSQCYCRRFTTPAMTDEQLRVNLPYEFRDYITQEKDKYNYDYAVLDDIRDEEGNIRELDLLGAAAPKDTISDCAEMCARGGFRLRVAVPDTVAYKNLIHHSGADRHSHCILVLGHSAVRFYMFDGEAIEAERTLDYGLSALDAIIADALHIDPHIACTYRESNHEDVLASPACQSFYDALAIEVVKAVNFYNFNHPNAPLEHIHCIGGGVKDGPLMDTLRRAQPLPLEDLSELLPQVPPSLMKDVPMVMAAVGATMQ